MRPRVVVTVGDLRGIGPEVTVGALGLLGAEGTDVDVTLLGPDGVLEPDELLAAATDARSDHMADAEAGRIALASIEAAVARARAGDADAVVTAPVHKPSLHAAGRAVPGQTELLRDLSGTREVAMLMAAEADSEQPALRVLLATTHIPLRRVPDAVTTELLTRQGWLLHESLQMDWALDAPRIAVCGLNPHASDGGLFGDEEELVISPAIDALRSGGVRAEGPLPADTVFTRALSGDFDAVIAPYHDVGMAAFKTATFRRGVNVSLGLPFVRTSPDHGTAFDIAGAGRADPRSMAEAVSLAQLLAKNRFDRDSGPV